MDRHSGKVLAEDFLFVFANSHSHSVDDSRTQSYVEH